MTLARSTLFRGPGLVRIGAAGPYLYDKDAINVALQLSRLPIPTTLYGVVDNRRDDRTAKITFTPAGNLTSAIVTALYPYLNPVIGSSIFGATDVPTTIQGKDGRLLTFANTAVANFPELRLTAGGTLFGQVEILAINKDATDPGTAGAFYTEAAATWADPATLNSADVKTLTYTAVWGDLILSFYTEAGWTIGGQVRTRPEKVDEIGTVDAILEEVSITAKCKPKNVSAATILTQTRLDGLGVARGMSERRGKDLTITAAGGSPVVVINNAALSNAGMLWANSGGRAGELEWIAHRAETAGAFGALATITV